MIETSFSFDADVYSPDAIQRAAYTFSDRLSIDLVLGQEIACTLHIVTDDPSIAEQVAGDFRNEVLDQVLRERIRLETADVRNLILAHAFSKSGLVPEE